MADDTAQPQQPAPPAGGGSPSRGAAPAQPAEAQNVLVTAEAKPDDGPGLTADEESELARLQAKAAGVTAGAEAVELKVEPPHSAMYHANVVVGTEFTPVNPALVPALETAAAAAGVTLTRKE